MIRLLLLLAALAGLGWHFRHAEPMRGLSAQLERVGERAVPMKAASVPVASAALRKCVKDSQVLYTNGACPAGSQVQTVDQGAVNVVPAQAMPAQTAGAAPGASSPTVLQRLAPPDGNLNKNKQIEAAMQR